jgi:hypothetical protein
MERVSGVHGEKCVRFSDGSKLTEKGMCVVCDGGCVVCVSLLLMVCRGCRDLGADCGEAGGRLQAVQCGCAGIGNGDAGRAS